MRSGLHSLRLGSSALVTWSHDWSQTRRQPLLWALREREKESRHDKTIYNGLSALTRIDQTRLSRLHLVDDEIL